MSHPDVVVIGGGIVGLATARALVRGGLEVILLERGACGAAASSAAAGLLEPFAEPDLSHAMRTACLSSLELWPEWLGEIQHESGRRLEFSERGTLFVAHTSEEAAFRKRVAADAAAFDVDLRWSSPDQIEADLSWLDAGAKGELLHLTGARRVDNPTLCEALAVACRAVGVRIVEECEVRSARLGSGAVHLDAARWSGSAAGIVLAAGCWSGAIDGLPTLPVRPRRGQLASWEGCDWEWNGCVRAGRRYVLRRGDDRLIAGSSVEDVGFDTSTTPKVVTQLARFAGRLVPALQGREPTRAWAGLRPGTPDDRPLVGRWHESPLWVATGHFRSGILLAPWTAARLAKQIVSGSPAAPEEPFSPLRFHEAAELEETARSR